MTTFEQIKTILEKKATALAEQSSNELDKIIDPDFFYVNSHGKKSNKQQYVELCCSSGILKFKSQKIDELEVQDFGAFAVASMILHDEFVYSGEHYSGSFRSLCVFKKVGLEWVWAAAQTSNL